MHKHSLGLVIMLVNRIIELRRERTRNNKKIGIEKNILDQTPNFHANSFTLENLCNLTP